MSASSINFNPLKSYSNRSIRPRKLLVRIQLPKQKPRKLVKLPLLSLKKEVIICLNKLKKVTNAHLSATNPCSILPKIFLREELRKHAIKL